MPQDGCLARNPADRRRKAEQEEPPAAQRPGMLRSPASPSAADTRRRSGSRASGRELPVRIRGADVADKGPKIVDLHHPAGLPLDYGAVSVARCSDHLGGEMEPNLRLTAVESRVFNLDLID